MSFSAICPVIICFNKRLVSGEETSLELDGGGSVDGMAEEDWIEVWRNGVTVEVRIEIEACGVVGYENWLEWRAVD